MAKRQPTAKATIWHGVLAHCAEECPAAGFTAADLEQGLKMAYPCAAQVLKRLQTWGYLRVVGFAPPAGGRGRRRKVYEVTASGAAKAKRDAGREG